MVILVIFTLSSVKLRRCVGVYMKRQFYKSRKIGAVAAVLAFLAFLAISFQNFSFKSEPLSFGKNNQAEMQDAVLSEVQVSDEEKKKRREAMENGAFDIHQQRNIDSLQIETGEVYEGGPQSDDMAQGLKQ